MVLWGVNICLKTSLPSLSHSPSRQHICLPSRASLFEFKNIYYLVSLSLSRFEGEGRKEDSRRRKEEEEAWARWTSPTSLSSTTLLPFSLPFSSRFPTSVWLLSKMVSTSYSSDSLLCFIRVSSISLFHHYDSIFNFMLLSIFNFILTHSHSTTYMLVRVFIFRSYCYTPKITLT
jgi:hypothetical protein